MRRLLARIACAAVTVLAASSQAASSALPDYSDLWWTPSENGWGAHVTLQENVVFLVLYVYDAERRARFFVASDMRFDAASTSTEHVFNGILYRTRGSPFSAAFDASRSGATPVGNATLRFTAPGTGTLTYSVDGATVVKAITRQAWRPVSLAGSYLGGTIVNASGCAGGLGLPSFAYTGSLEVAQSGDAVTIESRFETEFAQGGHCVMTGTMSQQGSLASIVQGTYDCDYQVGPNATSGTFEITAIEAGESGFSGRYRAVEGAPSCVHVGRFGGVRRGYLVLPSTPDPER